MNSLTDVHPATRPSARFAWLTLLLAAWIVVALGILSYALSTGQLNDILLTVYQIPFYLGIAAVGAVCLVLVVRAMRDGRGWRHAFPAGYGVLGVGFLALLAWPIAEIGWRVGVGLKDDSIEQFLAPSRLLIFFGGGLVALGPLRAALLARGSPSGRWPPAVSAAMVFVLASVIGFLPAQAAWLAAPRNEPQANSEIWLMNGDGSGQTRLLEAPGQFGFGSPAWSPDGTQFAYTRFTVPERQGAWVDDQAVWVANADGTDQRLLAEGSGWYWLPHWSPDGEWIIFTIDGQRGPNSAVSVPPPDVGFGQPPGFGEPASVLPNVDLWRVRADGTGPLERVTDDPAEDRAGVYSPDGRHLMFDSTRTEGRTAIYVADADGSNAVRVTFMGDDWGATWSPDGRRIAYNANPAGGPYDIYLLTYPSESEPYRLTDNPAGDGAPTWSPDGSRVAFRSEHDGQVDIFSIAVDGSDLRNLTNTEGVGEGLTSGGQAWGPSDRIIYVRTPDPPASASTLAREDLAVAEILLGALTLAILVLAVVAVGVPFGAVALISGLATAFAVIGSGEWRFLLPTIAGGLVVDVLIRITPVHRRPGVAGAASGAALVFASGLTVMATTGSAWTPTLLLGVTLVAAALGFLAAGLLPWRAHSGPANASADG